ncbi:MAG: YicC family protein [Proteobacteria bacterium]|nr:YicC family protein [Pseudomonadota bacterium]
MIASMTAYGRRALSQPWGQATWELRSVNHRYLDLTFKMPEGFREWENEWRSLAGNYVSRGKVECYLSFFPSHETAPKLQINMDLVKQLVSSCHAVAEHPGVTPTVKSMEILRFPEVLTSQTRDLSALKGPLTNLLEEAFSDLVQTRKREGQQLAHFIKDKLNQVLSHVALVKERLPLCLQAQKQKLMQKLADVQASLDPQRLEQELLLFAQRIDVEEEIGRLSTHTQEVARALNEKGAMGRRLDFLMQEMNREANTLAAKSQDGGITSAAIELKVLIEQMREQIQNVE